jgi:hypothetical protein
VDLLRGTLTVTVTRTTKMDGTTVEKAPKRDAGRRTIAIPANVVPAITDHLQRHVGLAPEALLFDCTDRALGFAWDRARRTVGRPDLHLHDYADIRVMPTFPRAVCSSRVNALQLSA